MKQKNPHAVALGELAKGKPKNYSAAELARRRKRIRAVNAKRAKVQQSKGSTATNSP